MKIKKTAKILSLILVLAMLVSSIPMGTVLTSAQSVIPAAEAEAPVVVGIPTIVQSQDKLSATLQTNNATVSKITWSYMGETDPAITTYAEYVDKAENSQKVKTGFEDGLTFNFDKIGYYTFFVDYYSATKSKTVSNIVTLSVSSADLGDRAFTVGIPVYVSLDKNSIIPPEGTKFKFELSAVSGKDLNNNNITIPMPAKTVIELDTPTKTGADNRVGYDIYDESNPWRMSFAEGGTYVYIVKQVCDITNSAYDLDAGYWKVTVRVKNGQAIVAITNEYGEEVSELSSNTFKFTQGLGSGGKVSTINGETVITIGGTYCPYGDWFDTAAVKSNFMVDFTRNFKVTGWVKTSSHPDGSEIGFVPDGTPQSSVPGGGSNGLDGTYQNRNGIFIEFDTYGNGGYTENYLSDLGGRHTALMRTNGSGYLYRVNNADGSNTVIRQNSSWFTNKKNYEISYDKTTDILTFAVGDTVYTFKDPKSAFGQSYAYFYMSSCIRNGPKYGYGVYNAEQNQVAFTSFEYTDNGLTGSNASIVDIFVNSFAPSLKLSDDKVSAVLVASGATINKVHYGYLGTSNKVLKNYDDFLANIKEKKTIMNPEDGYTFRLSEAGYYAFVIDYTAENGKSYSKLYDLRLRLDDAVVEGQIINSKGKIIGSYAKIEEAVEAVRNQETIKMLTGATVENGLVFEKSGKYTLDLNGQTLNIQNNGITVNAADDEEITLIVTDSVGTGTVNTTGNAISAISTENNSKAQITIKAGNFDTTDGYTFNTTGTNSAINVTGGKFINNDTTKVYADNLNLTVTGGVYVADPSVGKYVATAFVSRLTSEQPSMYTVEKAVPKVTLSADGLSAKLEVLDTQITKVKWGYVGTTNPAITTYDQYLAKVEKSMTGSIEDGSVYEFTKVGFYTFSVSAINPATGKNFDTFYTLEYTQESINIKNSPDLNTIKVGDILLEGAYIKVDDNNSKLTVKTPSKDYTLPYDVYQASIELTTTYNYYQADRDYLVTGVDLENGVITIDTAIPTISVDSNVFTLKTNSANVTKVNYSKMNATKMPTITSYSQFVDKALNRQSRSTGLVDGTAFMLKDAGFYTVVVNYYNVFKQKNDTAIVTFELKAETLATAMKSELIVSVSGNKVTAKMANGEKVQSISYVNTQNSNITATSNENYIVVPSAGSYKVTVIDIYGNEYTANIANGSFSDNATLDLAPLKKAIDSANNFNNLVGASDTVVVSYLDKKNNSAVTTSTANKTKFNNAIAEAQKIYSTSKSQKEIDKALNKLESALKDFKANLNVNLITVSDTKLGQKAAILAPSGVTINKGYMSTNAGVYTDYKSLKSAGIDSYKNGKNVIKQADGIYTYMANVTFGGVTFDTFQYVVYSNKTNALELVIKSLADIDPNSDQLSNANATVDTVVNAIVLATKGESSSSSGGSGSGNQQPQEQVKYSVQIAVDANKVTFTTENASKIYVTFGECTKWKQFQENGYKSLSATKGTAEYTAYANGTYTAIIKYTNGVEEYKTFVVDSVKAPVTLTENDGIINIAVNEGFAIVSLGYNYGLTADEYAEMWNVDANATSVTAFGNGQHTFKVRATDENNVAATYYITIDVKSVSEPVVVTTNNMIGAYTYGIDNVYAVAYATGTYTDWTAMSANANVISANQAFAKFAAGTYTFCFRTTTGDIFRTITIQ